jgi:hypothetical protein
MLRGIPIVLILAICFAVPVLSKAAAWAPIGRVTQATYGTRGHVADVTFTVKHYVIMATLAGSSEMHVGHKTFGFHSSTGQVGYLHLEILQAGRLFMNDYRDGETIRFAVHP